MCVEPYFDAYVKAAHLGGGTITGLPLRSTGSTGTSADFELDIPELEKTLSDKSRVLILNTPHNPTGKVFSRDELQAVADVVKKYPNLIVVADEVYEAAVFEVRARPLLRVPCPPLTQPPSLPAQGLTHERFATLDGMWERTISVFSAGKTFSCTGWRCGYMIGPSNLITPLQGAQGVIAFAGVTPIEVAVASAFKKAEETGYFESYAKMMEEKRDLLVNGLRDVGLEPVVPQGGYFTLCDTSASWCDPPAGSGYSSPEHETDPLWGRRDFRVAQMFTEDAKVTGIPPSASYSPHNRDPADNLLRFAHCKEDSDLTEAVRRLKEFKASRS